VRALAIVGAACLWGQAALGACDHPKPVHFAPGAISADLTGGIPRGELDCYTIGVRQGQHLTVDQAHAADSNIVFQLYRPPWSVKTGEDGVDVTGTALPGAEDGADAKQWSGALPVRGDYLLVVGTSFGGGEYRLRIEIK
jgi:hypothetical protein